MDDLSTGLLLSLAGLGTTFAALGLLYLTIILLRRLLPGSIEESTPPAPATFTPAVPATRQREQEVVAAAVAVSRLLAQRRGGGTQLGAVLEQPRGRWWQQHRTNLPSLHSHSRRQHHG